MAAAAEVVVPALREVRGAEAAMAERLAADAAIAPAGDYRTTLDAGALEARAHVRLIDERIDALQPRGPLPALVGSALSLAGQAARLPVELAVRVPAVALRREATGQQLLKNMEQESALAALAIATARAGTCIAETVDDTRTCDLLGSIRAENEDLLAELTRNLEHHAKQTAATATATAGEAADAARGPNHRPRGDRPGARARSQ